MKEVTTVGVDLAKSVFTVHGVDAAGRTVLRKSARRDKLMELIAGLPPCSSSSARRRSIASVACSPSLASCYPSAPTKFAGRRWSWPKGCPYSPARRLL